MISTFLDDSANILGVIQNGTTIGIADGSYMPKASTKLGTASWQLEDPTSYACCQGVTQTSREEHEVNAYRSELQGVHALLTAIWVVCTYWGTSMRPITIECNNKTATWLSEQDWEQLKMCTKHANLVQAIQKLKANIQIKLHFMHASGHQDNDVHFEHLNCVSQLSVLMDFEESVT